MHKFLRAVGFSDIRKKDLDMVLQDNVEHPEIMKIAKDSEGNEFAELSCSFAPNIGITVCGTFEDDDHFEIEYYYPYMFGTSITTNEQIEIEKHADKESYAGVCDELNIGVTLIFHVQNAADYLMEHNRHPARAYYGAMLAGLSVDGKIICPVMDKKKNSSYAVSNSEQHNQLMAEARNGNEDAIESLTLEDMDTYAVLSQRMQKEDILSIVKTSFMPYGIESDQYAIVGEIIDCVHLENKLTHETVYGMKLQCNNIYFDVCINEKDLLGEPAIGRRFKGSVWLQGNLYLE